MGKEIIRIFGIPIYRRKENGSVREYSFMGIKWLKVVRNIGETRRYFLGICYRRSKNDLKWWSNLHPAHMAYRIGEACNGPRTVLIFPGPGIGDYILMRNSLEAMRRSKKYRNCSFTMICDARIRELVEYLDREKFDDIIDCGEHMSYVGKPNFSQANRVRSNLRKQGLKGYYDTIVLAYQVLLNKPLDTVNRYLISYVAAREYIGYCYMCKQEHGRDFLHVTRVIPNWDLHLTSNVFDLYQRFFGTIIEEKINIPVPHIEIKSTSNKNDDQYIVIQPYCGSEESNIRNWHPLNWMSLIEKLALKYQLKIVLICSQSEKGAVERLYYDIHDSVPLVSIKTTSSQESLIELLYGASLYVGPDSGVFHIAAALGTNSICISAGRSYERFLKCYDRLSDGNARIVLPDGWRQWWSKLAEGTKSTFPHNSYKINAVTVTDVMDAVSSFKMRLNISRS